MNAMFEPATAILGLVVDVTGVTRAMSKMKLADAMVEKKNMVK